MTRMYAGQAGALSPSECIQLLGRPGIGRIALSIQALPAIIPVAFVFTDGQIYFRTIRHSQLDGAATDAVVAFETGELDPSGSGGWSVLVQGRAELVPEFRPGAREEGPDGRHRLFRVAPSIVTGQRLAVSLPETSRDGSSPRVPVLQPAAEG